jgi:hypothetical protein
LAVVESGQVVDRLRRWQGEDFDHGLTVCRIRGSSFEGDIADDVEPVRDRMR